jgi:lipid-binding SYLF domain-containing protein
MKNNALSFATGAIVAVVLVLGFAGVAHGQSKEATIIRDAATVFDEIMAAPDKEIPRAILDKAEAIAVFPGVLRAAFVFGGQRGRGIISVRNRGNNTWSAPAFLTITGGSWGAQIGGQSIDLVLVILNQRGVDNLLKNQFKIGGEASAAAGPVGRSAEAATDVLMRAQILSYSRSRGLFAGVAVNGSSVRADVDANQRMYGARLRSHEIAIERRGGSPAAIGRWRETLQKYFR